MTRVAAVDCGTNSVRLLICESDGRGGLRDVARELRLTRLGEGVDATREFAPAALARTLAAVDEYAALIRAAGCRRVRFVATSAARDARNRDAFFTGVRAALGIDAEIIPGQEEAELSFRGARLGVPGAVDPTLVMDVGGGSTELVLGSAGAVRHAVSLDMGSVRLRERFLHDEVPTPAQIAAASDFVDGLLDGSGTALGDVATWIGVAGTATTLAGAAQGLVSYDRARVHGSALTGAQLQALADELLRLDVAQIMARYPSIPRRRAEVIGGGALIVARLAARLPVPAMTVCESDLLDGIALGLLDAA